MPLPFNDRTARKWVCFVCGQAFTDFLDFKDHIKDKHDEGRDYIVCPMTHCQAPVRDLKMHFKVKHPGTDVPPIKMQRAMIWRDQTPSGKTKVRKPEFYGGLMISLKNHGREFHYKSRYECVVLECLEAIDEVAAYGYEPIKGGIPYLFEGEPHHYHPDLVIQFQDGHIEVWEIKPTSQTDLAVNKAKWAAAELYCQARNWGFVIITETGIAKLKKRVRKKQ
jgi:hypothetical protein